MANSKFKKLAVGLSVIFAASALTGCASKMKLPHSKKDAWFFTQNGSYDFNSSYEKGIVNKKFLKAVVGIGDVFTREAHGNKEKVCVYKTVVRNNRFKTIKQCEFRLIDKETKKKSKKTIKRKSGKGKYSLKQSKRPKNGMTSR